MLPQIQVFGKEIGTYALFGVIGVLISGWLFCRLLVKRGRCDSDGLLLLVFAGVGSAIGSHLLYGLTLIPYWSAFVSVTSIKEGLYLFGMLFGGGVFYGGLIGGLAVAFFYIKKKKLAMVDFSDCGAICIPLFHTFARVGCFFAGCCYGIEAKWGFSALANPYIPAVVGIRRFPTQLFEAALNVALFLALYAIRNAKSVRGSLIYLYLLSYSVIRFGVEFLRGDMIRGIWLGLSTSQWISICLFFISAIMLLRRTLQGDPAAVEE